MVILSPPIMLRSKSGSAEVTAHSTSRVDTLAALGITPRTAVNFGTQLPQVGSLSRTHSRPVSPTVPDTMVQSDYANSIR
jgi:hypothetical protein